MIEVFNIDKVEFFGKKVIYDGEVQDKCSLSNLINNAALACVQHGAKGITFPLSTDTRWKDLNYKKLSDILESYVNILKELKH